MQFTKIFAKIALSGLVVGAINGCDDDFGRSKCDDMMNYQRKQSCYNEAAQRQQDFEIDQSRQRAQTYKNAYLGDDYFKAASYIVSKNQVHEEHIFTNNPKPENIPEILFGYAESCDNAYKQQIVDGKITDPYKLYAYPVYPHTDAIIECVYIADTERREAIAAEKAAKELEDCRSDVPDLLSPLRGLVCG